MGNFPLEADRVAQDQTLSKQIVKVVDVLQQWEVTSEIANGIVGLVNDYRGAIDAASTVFGVVGAVWNIYSGLEKAKEDQARQEAMVQQLISAMDGMITRAANDIVTRIQQHSDNTEVNAVIAAGKAVQWNFRWNFVPWATTFPLSDVNAIKLDALTLQAEQAIEDFFSILQARAASGDSAAIIKVYRNLIAVVQCKLTMDKWRHGITQAVLEVAEAEMNRLLQSWAWVCAGFAKTSDRSFSEGLVYFEAGGDGRPKFTKYSYYYKGKAQPGSSSNMAAVSQAFINHRQAARGDPNLIPKELFEWQDHTVKIWQEIHELKKTAPP